MIIEIKPFDTLFFRDGKPFTMGNETWSNTTFPPSPSALFGALRSIYFANNPDKISSAASVENESYSNSADPSTNLQIKNIFLKMQNDITEFLFPMPLDIVKNKNDRYIPLMLKKCESLISNYPLQYYLKPDEAISVKSTEKCYIALNLLENYLTMEQNEFTCYEESSILLREPKIGIARDSKTHTSQEGKLYRTDLIRLNNTNIIIEFQNLNIPDKGLVRLGGEGKAAHYNYISDLKKLSPPDFKGNEKMFKLYLSTPAIFENGWFPKWISEENDFTGTINGIKLKLLTASIGKFINIGGFDMSAKKPKIMYRAVPAGSVLYFEIINNSKIEDVIPVFHNKSISDFKKSEGYGIAFIGKINKRS